MPSTLTWLDFSDAERRRALQVVELFALRETRDELGLGAIRDALADAMFPGVSTIQRRARYFLIVPWIFRAMESRPGDRLVNTRKAELTLIGVLQRNDDRDGIIGLRAGKGLKQLPSMIYWSGLERWGIKQRRGTREQWSRSQRHAAATDDGELLDAASWWHDNLVDPPPDFPSQASLSLDLREAEYLAERITTSCPGTLLSWLVARRAPWKPTDFVWELSILEELLPHHTRLVGHAQRFSEAMHGAALLYNLMLAEETEDEERQESYSALLGEWRELTYAQWDIGDFWTLTGEVASRHDPLARRFIDAWLDIARSHVDPRNSRDARTLVRAREHEVKRRHARLSYDTARDTWRGAAGAGQLEYRWNSTQRQLLDIVTPCGGLTARPSRPATPARRARPSRRLHARPGDRNDLHARSARAAARSSRRDGAPLVGDRRRSSSQPVRAADGAAPQRQPNLAVLPRRRHQGSRQPHPAARVPRELGASVTPPTTAGVFHPKCWLLRFAPEYDDEPVRYRLLVLSRNLTFDRSWDVALVTRRRAPGAPAAQQPQPPPG